ncbi:MAG: right-handed parallel beta-helix repeat-containing protein [Anaerolinea sp.]|nr:right-handed parallel beta-helix repeat-containing protein [Anaerolinea sp.]
MVRHKWLLYLVLLLVCSLWILPVQGQELRHPRGQDFRPIQTSEAQVVNGQTYVVNTTGYVGGDCTTTCSLPRAIEVANSDGDTDLIIFNLPGSGIHIHSVSSGLRIREPVVIDATTQPGYDGTPLFELRASMSGIPDGIYVEDTSSYSFDPTLTVTIKGLAITGFDAGTGILLGNGQGHLIEGNYIGVTADLYGFGNATGIAMRASNSIIRNNLVATNRYAGLYMSTNAGRASDNNTIVGNSFIQNDTGIEIRDGAQNNTIGGDTWQEGNLISGNDNAGVRFIDAGVDGNALYNNYIGTDAWGEEAWANGSFGVTIQNGSGNIVGGVLNGVPSGNLISGNQSTAVSIVGSEVYPAADNVVQGNLIGTDWSGMVAIPNERGVSVNAAHTLVGGSNPGEPNLISGNTFGGITISGANAAGSRIVGNLIGTNIDGTGALSNHSSGIAVGSAQNVTIEGNLIAFNNDQALGSYGGGISFYTNGTGVSILGNSIHSNGGIGIGLNNNGNPLPNDPGDIDTGANNRQNYPVLSALTSSTSAVINGTLNSLANTTFRVELFSNPQCDPSGYGEGAYYLGALNVTTNGAGNASFSYPVNQSLTGSMVTGTATAPDGSTSEFSLCATAAVSTSPTISDLPDQTVMAGTPLAPINFTVNDSQTPAANLVVTAASSNQTLLPDANLIVGGSGGTRTLTVTPVSGQVGSAVVTVTVADGDGLTASDTFTVTIQPLPVGVPTAPTGTVTGAQPMFTWSHFGGPARYYVWIAGAEGYSHSEWFESADVCSATECATTIDTFATGYYTWWLQTWTDASGTSEWSAPMPFTVSLPPVAPVPVSPADTVAPGTTITFTWNSVPSGSWYYLWVSNGNGHVLDQWYAAADFCANGQCSVTPAGVNYPSSSYTWWVQAWSEINSYSPWSEGMNFVIATPPTPAPLAPIGQIEDSTPAFQWTDEPGLTWYHLWLVFPDGSGQEYWYEDWAVCSGGVCSAEPIQMVEGIYRWWVQGWSAGSFTAWSAETWFTLPLSAPNATAPIGTIATGSPTFTWTPVAGSYWYYIWVSSPTTGYVMDQWYNAYAVCSASVCTVTPPLNLPDGEYTWWIAGWSPVTNAQGAWSTGCAFTVDASPLMDAEPPLPEAPSHDLPDVNPPAGG